MRTRSRTLPLLAALALAGGLAACSGKSPTMPGAQGPPRSFRMGFSAIPPKADFELLDRARAHAVFQLTFTDLSPTIFPPGAILPFFATLGLVDTALLAKPSLAPWDSAFARPRS